MPGWGSFALSVGGGIGAGHAPRGSLEGNGKHGRLSHAIPRRWPAHATLESMGMDERPLEDAIRQLLNGQDGWTAEELEELMGRVGASMVHGLRLAPPEMMPPGVPWPVEHWLCFPWPANIPPQMLAIVLACMAEHLRGAEIMVVREDGEER